MENLKRSDGMMPVVYLTTLIVIAEIAPLLWVYYVETIPPSTLPPQTLAMGKRLHPPLRYSLPTTKTLCS
jgi:hypothetical protein